MNCQDGNFWFGFFFRSFAISIFLLTTVCHAEDARQPNTEKYIAVSPDYEKFLIPKKKEIETANKSTSDKPTVDNKLKKNTPQKDKLVNLSGSLRNETAYRLNNPSRLSKFRDQIRLSNTTVFDDDLKFVASGRIFYDSVFDINNEYSTQVAQDLRYFSQLRDFYVDYSVGNLDFRIGNQQIVWGEAVGLFFTDIVNAKDYREFVLQDFDLIRLPEWALNASYIKDNLTLEFIWLPQPKMNKLGVPGSEFSFNSNTPPLAINNNNPTLNIANSEIGGRSVYLLNDLNLSAFYLYTWDKSGIIKSKSPGGSTNPLERDYERIHVLGGTFSKPLGDIMLKGELAYNAGSQIQLAGSNGISNTQSDFLDYMLGFDYTFTGGLRTNTQIIQHAITNYQDSIVGYDRALTTYLSLWCSYLFWDDQLEPELFLLTGLTNSELMARPAINYKLNDNWKVKIGADLFNGQQNLIFGQFQNSSRVYSQINYYF